MRKIIKKLLAFSTVSFMLLSNLAVLASTAEKTIIEAEDKVAEPKIEVQEEIKAEGQVPEVDETEAKVQESIEPLVKLLKQEVLEAMVSKAKTLGLGQLVNLVNLLIPKISTNLSTGDIISLIPTLLKVNFTESIGWPYTTKGITLDRWYGVPTTLESNVIKFHKEIFGNENYTLPEEIKTISDQIVSKTGYKEK